MVILLIQAALSAAAVFQLYRTRMLPVYYLVILGALLALVWLLFFKCQPYKVRGALTRLLSLVLSAGMAVGCVWAQQGLDALDKVTLGDETAQPPDYETLAITTEPFVVYLSGVDNRGELTENARSDVNILAVVNPVTKRVALVNTPRDYYVDLAGTDSKDKLTHAGLYGVETSMETLGGLYGIEVDHYVRINFAGFIDIVDALGGVDVYSDMAFTSVGSPGYYDPTDFVEGWNHLDGAAALAFARERHAFATGDIQRLYSSRYIVNTLPFCFVCVNGAADRPLVYDSSYSLCQRNCSVNSIICNKFAAAKPANSTKRGRVSGWSGGTAPEGLGFRRRRRRCRPRCRRPPRGRGPLPR